MLAYIVRRLFLMLLTLIGISIVIFVLLRIVPGNIVDILFAAAGYVDPADKVELERSLGIDQRSVVNDPALIADRVERLRRAYGGSVLLESYLPGPEFNLGLIAVPEPRVLPVSQVVFEERPGCWPMPTRR